MQSGSDFPVVSQKSRVIYSASKNRKDKVEQTDKSRNNKAVSSQPILADIKGIPEHMEIQLIDQNTG